jgi:RsbT co-antagonist protein rsbRD N-terminal domain
MPVEEWEHVVTIAEHLIRKRSAVLDRWYDHVLESYHADTAQFMRDTRDRFKNPVGSAIRRDMEALYDFVVNGDPSSEVHPFPEDIVKIRAVQDFLPSEAVAFVFQLKMAIDDVLGPEGVAIAGRRAIDDKIDRLALAAFDEYMKCREKIFTIRVGEIRKNLTGR